MLLARFGRRIASDTRIDSLLTIIAEEVRHILYADRCSVFLIEAEKHELDRDQARLNSGAFGKAVIYLQIAILLASIAALLKRKPIYYVGLAAGAWGLVNFVNGFMLFM